MREWPVLALWSFRRHLAQNQQSACKADMVAGDKPALWMMVVVVMVVMIVMMINCSHDIYITC